MELFIRIKDGQPFEHPILGDNFRAAFPQINPENLPPEFAPFDRTTPPDVGAYEVYQGVTYEWDDGRVKDVHHVHQMTAQEKTDKQKAAKGAWVAFPNWSSWTFDEATCSFKPPVPYPTDGKRYRWNESALAWVEIESELPPLVWPE